MYILEFVCTLIRDHSYQNQVKPTSTAHGKRTSLAKMNAGNPSSKQTKPNNHVNHNFITFRAGEFGISDTFSAES